MFVYFSLSMKENSVKQVVFLFAACICPHGLLFAVSADEPRSVALTADEIVQEEEVTVSSADTEDVQSEISITATVNATEVTVDENVQNAADDGADSAPDAGALAVSSHEQIVIRLGGNADKVSTLSTIVDDSQTKGPMDGKIVVIGPDGKKQEFTISGNAQGKMFKIVAGEESTGNADQQASHIDSIVRILKLHDTSGTAPGGGPVGEARMAMGVQCEDVPDALRSHLNLGEKGIMIVHVREQSPASEAALMKFDIIVQIGDTDVASTDDLVSAVAASDGTELALSIIRHGEPMKVVVTPKKMKFSVLLAPAQTGLIHGHLNSQNGINIVRNPAWDSIPESVKKQQADHIGVQNSLHKFHPGVVIEQRMPSNEKDMQALLEHVRQLAEDSGKVAQIRAQKALALVSDESGDADGVAESIKALRVQVRSMEQQLDRLQKRLDAEPEEKK
jgi:hypothetical protein